MTIKHKLIFFFPFLFFQITQAQQEFGLYFLTETWQSNKVNPSFMSDQKLTIALPGLSNNLSFTGPTYGDLVREREGKTVIDIDQAISKMSDKNIIREELQIETLSLAFRKGDWQISVGHSIRNTAFISYPKTLPQVIWQGNAQFIGETIEIDNDILLQSYHELTFGIARKFGDKLTFGAKIKYLNGIANAETNPDRNEISIHADEEYYELAINTNYQLNSTGVAVYSGLSDFNLNFNLGEITTENLISGNGGWGFDAGLTYKSDRLTFSASILDIGSITWSDNARNYTTNGNFEYSGLDISGALTGDSVNFSNAVDTLENLLEIVETENSYDVSLSSKFYLSAAYQVNEKITTGLVYYTEQFREETYSGISAGLNWKALPNLSLGATYSALFEQKEYANIGVSGVLKVGPLQIFAVTDNIVSLFQIENSNFFSARLGVNLIFGRTVSEEPSGGRYF